MNKIFIILLLLFLFNPLFSQVENCSCLDEINNVSELIKNSKSYKVQIKNLKKEADFAKWYEKIQQEIIADSLSAYFCAGYLQKYISFIKDRHNEIYKIPNEILANVPDYYKEIDTSQHSIDSIAGLYYMGVDKIAVIKENDSLWYGVQLVSSSVAWTKGKIRLRIKKTTNDFYEIFEFYPNGLLFYQKNILITEGRIHSTFWNKQNKYYFNVNNENEFTFKSINSSTDYIGISSFKRTKKLMDIATAFYDEHLKKLNKESLIIDLRNNGGGAVKQAEVLMKSLGKNNKIKNIYVLINFKTGSSAEIVALELRKDKRTIIVGENSLGMIAYGKGNKAYSTQTECARYKVILSTELTDKKLDVYEYIGITPDYLFNNSVDWIEQVVDFDKLKNKDD